MRAIIAALALSLLASHAAQADRRDQYIRVFPPAAPPSVPSEAAFTSGQWKQIADNELGETYVNPSSARRGGGKGQIWTLMNYPEAQTEGGAQFRSEVISLEFYCGQRLFSVAAKHSYSEPFGKGSLVRSKGAAASVTPISPGSAVEDIAKMACE
jgi:hypothetical protein